MEKKIPIFLAGLLIAPEAQALTDRARLPPSISAAISNQICFEEEHWGRDYALGKRVRAAVRVSGKTVRLRMDSVQSVPGSARWSNEFVISTNGHRSIVVNSLGFNYSEIVADARLRETFDRFYDDGIQYLDFELPKNCNSLNTDVREARLISDNIIETIKAHVREVNSLKPKTYIAKEKITIDKFSSMDPEVLVLINRTNELFRVALRSPEDPFGMKYRREHQFPMDQGAGPGTAELGQKVSLRGSSHWIVASGITVPVH